MMTSPQATASTKPGPFDPDKGSHLGSGQIGIPNDTPTHVGATSKEHESKQTYIQGVRLHLIITAYVSVENGLPDLQNGH
jgi:hypothetical protein